MRTKKHKKYYKIPAFQILSKKTMMRWRKYLVYAKEPIRKRLKDIRILLPNKEKFFHLFLVYLKTKFL